MNAIIKSPFAWLLRREYWEERRGFLWAQIVAAGVILGITILGIIAGEVLRVRMGVDSSVHMGAANLSEMLRMATTHDTDQLVKALDMTLLLFGFISSIVLTFVVFFYLLGALYDDRRDRSILFWKSLPVSDTATVISKVIAAIIIAPLIAVAVTLAGYIGAQIVISLWFLAHGVNPFGLLWAHVQPFSVWLHLLVMVPVNAVWALPTVGWLLLWSAAVRSKPFLWAVVIPIIAGVLNFWIGLLGLPNIDSRFFWGDLVGRALLSVIPAGWIAPNASYLTTNGVNFVGGDQLAAISYSSMAHAFALPEMWIGAIVGIALIAAAIWFRRWRDEA
ncbi:MAG: ABC transporter, permease protein [Rhodanobacteraceae bacterium]|jgi:ABC-2 type transport system permease protein|nr:MAG: ABC transporter, permease protein [Rhodanobacteraceae bacterium]